jgi:hypothetical protein
MISNSILNSAGIGAQLAALCPASPQQAPCHDVHLAISMSYGFTPGCARVRICRLRGKYCRATPAAASPLPRLVTDKSGVF